MYEQFYGLHDKPFSLTPNPEFVFQSQQYKDIESQLIYGINNHEGLMLVTGHSGSGKTTLCRDLRGMLDREMARSALLVNPSLSATEMLTALLTEFGVSAPADGTRKELLDRLKQFLLAQLALGKNCVAIFDEAQHLSPEVLEQIRVLSNLETDQEKLIQIVFFGQPELLDKIRTPEMSQLDQRVSIRCTLMDLNEQDTGRYIQHRLNVAGARGQVTFSPNAVNEIYRGSHGVPRLINLICDRALLIGYASRTRDIEPAHVQKAIAALRGEDVEATVEATVKGTVKGTVDASPPAKSRASRGRVALIAALVVVAGAVSAGVAFWPRATPTPADQRAYDGTMVQTSAADAEASLEAFVAGFPASSHVNEALDRLARLELSRGDRPAALQHFTQLAQHAPPGIDRTRAIVSAASIQLDAGDTTAACERLSPDLTSTAAADTSLTTRLTAVSSLCASRVSALPPVPDSVASRARDSTATAPPDSAALRKPDSSGVRRGKRGVPPPRIRP